ncbi:hypothetical protein FB451DRAFT_1365797 [Mycena latifolia]|nr:hypothetical protein FB451DRAFT_1365797 [Mycena latifolia]
MKLSTLEYDPDEFDSHTDEPEEPRGRVHRPCPRRRRAHAAGARRATRRTRPLRVRTRTTPRRTSGLRRAGARARGDTAGFRDLRWRSNEPPITDALLRKGVCREHIEALTHTSVSALLPNLHGPLPARAVPCVLPGPKISIARLSLRPRNCIFGWWFAFVRSGGISHEPQTHFASTPLKLVKRRPGVLSRNCTIWLHAPPQLRGGAMYRDFPSSARGTLLIHEPRRRRLSFTPPPISLAISIPQFSALHDATITANCVCSDMLHASGRWTFAAANAATITNPALLLSRGPNHDRRISLSLHFSPFFSVASPPAPLFTQYARSREGLRDWELGNVMGFFALAKEFGLEAQSARKSPLLLETQRALIASFQEGGTPTARK